MPATRRASWTPAWVAATWFGVGLTPVAPGTAGTLAAVPLVFLLWMPGLPWLVPAAAAVIAAVGVVAGGIVARDLGEHDPQHVVIDEVAGYLLACSLSPPGWRTATLAFVLFRILDAWKPGPIQRLEALPGGWGVMADDLGAGLLSGVLCWLAWGLVAGTWLGPFGP